MTSSEELLFLEEPQAALAQVEQILKKDKAEHNLSELSREFYSVLQHTLKAEYAAALDASLTLKTLLPLSAFEDRSKEIVNGDCTRMHWLLLLLLGKSFLDLFVAINITGPAIATPHVLSNAHLSEDERRKILEILEVDGESLHRFVSNPVYLYAAKILLMDMHSSLGEKLLVSSLLAGRCARIYQTVITGRTPTLKSAAFKHYDDTTSAIRNTVRSVIPEDKQWLLAQPFVEAALIRNLYQDAAGARELLEQAQAFTGLTFSLTGKLGRRTKFQTFDLPQLTLEASSAQFTEGTAQAENLPSSVANPDDILLEKIQFKDEDGESNNKLPLRIIDQVILLAFCIDVQNNNPRHGLTSAEIMPYVERVLQNAQNWMVHSFALLQRSRLEKDRSRTRERAALQIQALVDQFYDVGEAAVAERMKFVYALDYPPLGLLKRELGMRFLELGVAASAKQLFEELEMWDEIVQCYAIMDQMHEAAEVVRERLKVESKSAHLWCILGEIVDDPLHLEKAWVLSKYRSARAKRSLGTFYLKRQEYRKAMDHYEKALAINPLYPNVWFSYGCCAMKEQLWEKASHAFSRVVQIDPEEGDAWNNLASVNIQLGKKKEAFYALKEGLKTKRQDWRVWQNLLFVAVDVGEFASAILAYNKLLTLVGAKALDIEVLRILVKVVHHNIACADGNEGYRLLRQVTDLLERCSIVGAANPDIWDVLAEFYEFEKKFEEVLACRQKQVRQIQSSNWKADANLFAKVVTAVKALADSAIAQADTKALYSTKLQLRNFAKKAEEIYGNTPTYQLLMETLSTVTESEQKQLASR